MKSNLKLLIQNVQDVYTTTVNTTIFITDLNGNPITNFSKISPFTKLIVQCPRVSLINLLQATIKKYQKFSKPMVIDLEPFSKTLGIKCFLVPIINKKGSVSNYIWAGAFIEEEFREHLEAQFDHVPLSTEWKNAIRLLPIFSNYIVQEKLSELAKMSAICSELSSKQNNNQTLISEKLDDKTLLHNLKKTEELDFIGLALLKETNVKINFFLGECSDRLISKSFDLNQSFFYQPYQSTKLEVLEYVDFEHRLYPFIQADICLNSFFCLPVMVRNEVKAFIFGGYKNIATFKSSFYHSVEFTGNLLGLIMNNEALTSLVDLHLMRLTTLMELSKAMHIINDLSELLFMIVDIAKNIIYGSFSSIILKNNQFEVINTSDNFHGEYFNHYLQEVQSNYFKVNEITPFKTPRIHMKDQIIILECPIRFDNQLQGVLSVGLSQENQLKEAEAYLSSLASISTIILKSFMEKRNIHIDKLQTTKINGDKDLASKPHFELLTNREKEVLTLLVRGMSNKDIAESLFISAHTVKNHVTNIFQKLGVSDRAHMIAMVYKLNHKV